MERCNHRVMAESAEFGAVNFVVPGLERLEPVDVEMTRDHIELEVERRNPEGMGDIDGLEDELDGLPHFDGEAARRWYDGPGGEEGRREVPRPLPRGHDRDRVRVLRDRVRHDERLESRNSDHDQ